MTLNSPAQIVDDISDEKLEILDKMLLETDGTMTILPSKILLDIPQEYLSVWCHKRARYGLPTQELICWLECQIDGSKAIEIGSGSGDLGRHLNIIQTDSKVQRRPDVAEMFKSMGQPTIVYPDFVENLNAKQAVRKYKPQVVIGSWITQYGTPDVKPSSPFGVNEGKMLKNIDKYIMIGHEQSHHGKTIFELPHKIFKFNWICSRALERSRNVIYVWDKTRRVDDEQGD